MGSLSILYGDVLWRIRNGSGLIARTKIMVSTALPCGKPCHVRYVFLGATKFLTFLFEHFKGKEVFEQIWLLFFIGLCNIFATILGYFGRGPHDFDRLCRFH